MAVGSKWMMLGKRKTAVVSAALILVCVVAGCSSGGQQAAGGGRTPRAPRSAGALPAATPPPLSGSPSPWPATATGASPTGPGGSPSGPWPSGTVSSPVPASPGTVPPPSSSGSPPPAHSKSPEFTLGWYQADSSRFDTSAIDALPFKPHVVNYYSGWEEPFNTRFARAARADGIETFVEMEPWNCGQCPVSAPAMSDVAAGQYDWYLARFGHQIRAFGHPVLVTFAHEMNAPWYPWGSGGMEGTTPAQWIAAWDHVVTVLDRAAPHLITWVWAPNVEIGAGPVAPYWPGKRYVDLVGLDGYLTTDGATFHDMFGSTLAEVRQLTRLPIWIAETGLNQDDSTGSRLAGLAKAISACGATGFLYFDEGANSLTGPEEESLAHVLGSLDAGTVISEVIGHVAAMSDLTAAGRLKLSRF